MQQEIKNMFAGKRAVAMGQLMARFGREKLPEIEHIIARLIQAGKIRVLALPGSPMSEVNPDHPQPKRKAAMFILLPISRECRHKLFVGRVYLWYCKI